MININYVMPFVIFYLVVISQNINSASLNAKHSRLKLVGIRRIIAGLTAFIVKIYYKLFFTFGW